MRTSFNPLSRRESWLSTIAIARHSWRRPVELAGLAAVLALAVAVRVVRLGSVPRIITGDEAANLHTAYSIIEGSGPGPFGFDWNHSPILGLYPLAWTIQIFGNSVADFRIYTVVLSLLTIVLFYVLARESLGTFAALAATVLLSTNLLFLNFSRTAWENITAAFFAVGACWATTRALKGDGRWWVWWSVVGVFLAGGLYGYFAGRLLFAPIALAAAIGASTRLVPWHRAAAGIAIAALVTAVLFSPAVPRIVRHWHEFNTRTNAVSVFRGRGAFDRAPWQTVRANLGRNYRGLILQDGSEFSRGLWERYGPEKRAPLDLVTTHLFWAGLVVSALHWRKTYTWWPFFVPLLVVEIFSGGTPDLARALFFAPFYFLFVGSAFDEALHLASRPLLKATTIAAIIAVVAFVATSDIRGYFAWQHKPATQIVRLPGVDRCEFPLFEQLARAAAAAGTSMNNMTFDSQRRELDCSPITQAIPEQPLNLDGS